jgi:hypothetical protein
MELLTQPLPPGFEVKLFNGLPVLELDHAEMCCRCKCPRHLFRFDGSVPAPERKRLVCVVCAAAESIARRSV